MFFKGMMLLGLKALAPQALTVVSPVENLTVVSGRTFTVEWADFGNNTDFAIDLFHQQSSTHETGCGMFVAMLCPHDEKCMDGSGDYDVIFPDPLQNVPEAGYVVGVKGAYDTFYGCSAEFRLVTEDDVPETNEYSLNITAPADGDVAIIGDQYTVEWKYLNGVGSSSDRFDVDLYRATRNSEPCGTYVEALCDKSLIGCRDSSGDFLITIPHDVSPGEYRIRVARFEDDSIYDCSGVFTIVGEWSDGISYSMSFGDAIRPCS
jgi:hypothetical protein